MNIFEAHPTISMFIVMCLIAFLRRDKAANK